jgi:hypothetical protein
MAAPHAAGVAAQCLSLNPAAAPLTVMNFIKGTATAGVVTLNPPSVAYATPNRLLYTGLRRRPPRRGRAGRVGAEKEKPAIERNPERGRQETEGVFCRPCSICLRPLAALVHGVIRPFGDLGAAAVYGIPG